MGLLDWHAGVLVPDPALQDSLQRLNEADPLQGEQTWPTAQVRQGSPSCFAPQAKQRASVWAFCEAVLLRVDAEMIWAQHTRALAASPFEVLTCRLLGTCWLTSAFGASRCLAATLWQPSYLLVLQQELYRCLAAAQHPSLPGCGCIVLGTATHALQKPLGLTP